MRSFFITLESLSQRLHKNILFEWVTVGVILVSSLAIGAKSYTLPPQAETGLVILNAVVTAYFLAEICIRMIAAGGVRPFFRAGWNIFDFIIVMISLIPVPEDQDYVLLARLLRLFRVMRMIYIVPQLRLMVSALLRVLPRINYVALMMFIIFYIYGVVGNALFEKVDEGLWGDVGLAMLTLFRVATLEDWTDVMYATMEHYPLSWSYFVSFIFLSAFVFLNMMIGVIVESLSEEYNASEKAATRAHQEEMDARLRRIEEKLDAMGRGR